MPTTSYSHTDSLGWLISDDPDNTDRYVVEIFYGSWHSTVGQAEGSLVLNGPEDYTDEQTFVLVDGYTNVANGVVPDGLVLGENYFFPNRTTADPADFTSDDAGRSIYNFQSVGFANLDEGDYTFGYSEGSSFTADWEPSDPAINAGSFTIGEGGTIEVDGAEPSTPDIDTEKSNYTTEELNESEVNPTFDGGTLAVGDSGTVSSDFTVNATNGTVDTGSNTSTFSGNFSGAGKITKSGSGTLNLTGTNSNSGGFAVSAGTLSVNSAAALGSGGLELDGGTFATTADMTMSNSVTVGASNGTLEVNSSTNTVSGAVSGSGTLTKSGSGTLRFTSDSPFTGDLAVDNGSVQVDSTFSAVNEIIVRSGGTLLGTGTIGGNVTVQNGGTISPGSSPGTTTIAGDVTLNDGSLTVIEIDGEGTGNGAGNFDRIIVTGGASTFTADGELEIELRGISAPANNDFTPDLGDTFVIVEAANIAGTFDTLTQPDSGLADNTRFDVIYGSSTITLIVTEALLADAASRFGRLNAVTAGAALDGIRPAVLGDDAASELFIDLAELSEPEVADSLQQISGEIYADMQFSARDVNREIRDGVIEAAFRPISATPPDLSSALKTEAGVDQFLEDLAVSFTGTESIAALGQAIGSSLQLSPIWVEGSGRYLSVNDDDHAENFDAFDGAIYGGIDIFGGDTWRTGIAVGYARGHVDANSIGNGDFDTVSVLAYSGAQFRALKLAGSVGGSYTWYDVNRDVSLSDGDTDLDNDYDGYSFHADVEGKYTIPLPVEGLAASPVAGLRTEFAHVNSSDESGEDLVALERQSDNYYSGQARAGLELSLSRTIGKMPVRAAATALFLAELGDDDNATADLELHGAEWTVRAADPGRYSGLVGTTLAVSLTNELDARVGYSGRFNDDLAAHQVNLGISYRW